MTLKNFTPVLLIFTGSEQLADITLSTITKPANDMRMADSAISILPTMHLADGQHRGNTFFDVTVTGQWSSPSACLPSKFIQSIDERIGILVV